MGHKKILEGREKADRLGTLGSEAQSGDVSPGFSFSFVYSRLGAEEAGNLEMPKEQPKKNPQQKPILSSQKTRKEQPNQTKFLGSNHILQLKTTTEQWPHSHPHQQKWIGNLDLLPH